MDTFKSRNLVFALDIEFHHRISKEYYVDNILDTESQHE